MTREVSLIWVLVAATLVALVATYSRLPANELYNVSHSGIRSALGRAVVDLNFPDSLIALAVLGVVGPRPTPRGKRLAVVAATGSRPRRRRAARAAARSGSAAAMRSRAGRDVDVARGPARDPIIWFTWFRAAAAATDAEADLRRTRSAAQPS